MSKTIGQAVMVRASCLACVVGAGGRLLLLCVIVVWLVIDKTTPVKTNSPGALLYIPVSSIILASVNTHGVHELVLCPPA